MKIDYQHEIYLILKDKYGGKYPPEIADDIRRLKAGEPTDYIIGWTPFLDCRIDLRYRPMIPRPETEDWVERFIGQLRIADYGLRKKRTKLKILDVFAGSGCIGIAVLKNCPGLVEQVDFAEADPKMVKQIKLNLRLNKIAPSRYRVFCSDVFQKIKGRYDYILANPPYVTARTPKRGMMRYEPSQAFFAGRAGLGYIKKFLKEAPGYLVSACGEHARPEPAEGVESTSEIWMEFGAGQKRAIGELLERYGYRDGHFFRDQFKKWRFLKAACR